MAGVKATRNLRTPWVPGKVQGLRFLPAQERDLVLLQLGRIKGCQGNKRVSSHFSGCQRPVKCSGAKAQSFRGQRRPGGGKGIPC